VLKILLRVNEISPVHVGEHMELKNTPWIPAEVWVIQSKELLAGGLANAIASSLLNPFDVVKVRLQTQPLGAPIYRNFATALQSIAQQEGIFRKWGGLWFPGLPASILREMGYSSFRFGLYPLIRDFYSSFHDSKQSSLLIKVFAGLTTGGLGSAMANPTDLIKIRFQSEAGLLGVDGRYETGLHKGQFPTYSSTRRAFVEIWRQEGIAGLYRGAIPTMSRAGVLAAAQLSSYDHSKSWLKSQGLFGEGVRLHVTCSVISAFLTACASQPFDTVKSRYMADISKNYAGPIECAIKIFRTEGLTGFYRGWIPSFLRFAPHFTIAFPLWEQIRHLFGLGFFK